MMKSKTILISTLVTSFLVVAGCSTQTATNTNAVTNTNTVNTNVTVNTNEDTNSVVSNQNIKIVQGNEVDTSDWQVYINDEIGLQFEYPVSDDVEFHLTDCTVGQCGSSTGLSYYINTIDKKGELNLAFAGAATPDFQADRDLGFFDVTFFKNNGYDFEAVLSEGNGFVIHPTMQKTYKNGEVVIYEIKDLPSYPQLVDVIPERKDDKVAIYNFNEAVKEFKSISIILTPEMSEQDIDRILNSLVIL